MKYIAIVAVVMLCVGCADQMYGLKDYQKTRVRQWQQEGIEIKEEKSTQTATALGFFFGLGSFYTDEPVLGVLGLIFWPWSIMWDPWLAPAKANKINYEATRDYVEYQTKQ